MLEMQAESRGLRLILDLEGLGVALDTGDDQQSSMAREKAPINQTIKDEFYSDAMRIKQIVLNLVANAFKFTERGEVRIAAQKLDSENIRITGTIICFFKSLSCKFKEI